MEPTEVSLKLYNRLRSPGQLLCLLKLARVECQLHYIALPRPFQDHLEPTHRAKKP